MYPTYQCRPLQGDEIRLVELLPGSSSIDICIRICHEPILPHVPQDARLSRDELQQTLPKGWRVFQTPEGRYLFSQGPEYQRAYFHHPEPGIRPELYVGTLATATQPKFEALSYVWGSPGGDSVAYIRNDTHDTWTTPPIWRNLAQALPSLRHADRPRTLWVDAICINQDDLEERAIQVKRMGLIYRQASRVVAWLGLASGDSKLALEVLQNLGRQVEMSDSQRLFDAPEAEEEWWVGQGMSPPQYRALVELIARPWLQRVWVIQEIALANNSALIRCGNDEIDYYHFRRAVAFLSRSSGDELHELLRGPASICWGLARVDTVKLLLMSRGRQCSDPRDKFFGVLSLVGPKLAESLQPSYTQDYVEVYKELFMRHSEQTGRLDLLINCSGPNAARNKSLPSWVPDWRSDPEHKIFLVPGSRCVRHQARTVDSMRQRR